jgi:GT2 family glycosyltransferase
MPEHHPDIWVVLVNYNGTDDTLKCLDSLAAQTEPRFRTVVVDNASADDPCGLLRAKHPGVDVLRNTENLGWSGGNNTGIRHALARGAGQVILLNNDTTVSADFIAVMIDAARRFPRHGVLGPVIRFMEPPCGVMTDGCDFNRAGREGFFQRREVAVAKGDAPPRMTDADIVNGCCMMVNARVFEAVGGIDDRFFLIHEESDFCLRARRAGFRCGVFDRALVWHKGSVSFKRSGKSLQRYYDSRNLLLLLCKHGRHTAGARDLPRAALHYLRYLYHRASHEWEARHAESAAAVGAGLVDALARRFGPRRRAVAAR